MWIILADSILANFILGLNLNIFMLLYKLILMNLNKVIIKAKIIEMKQKNTLGII